MVKFGVMIEIRGFVSRCLGVAVWLLTFPPIGPLVLWARLCARFPFLPACVVRLVSSFT